MKVANPVTSIVTNQSTPNEDFCYDLTTSTNLELAHAKRRASWGGFRSASSGCSQQSYRTSEQAAHSPSPGGSPRKRSSKLLKLLGLRRSASTNVTSEMPDFGRAKCAMHDSAFLPDCGQQSQPSSMPATPQKASSLGQASPTAAFAQEGLSRQPSFGSKNADPVGSAKPMPVQVSQDSAHFGSLLELPEPQPKRQPEIPKLFGLGDEFVSPFAQAPHTPEAREAAPPKFGSVCGMPRNNSCVEQAKAALEEMIHKSIPVCGDNFPGGLQLVKLSALSQKQLEVSPRVDLDSANFNNSCLQRAAGMPMKKTSAPSRAASEQDKASSAGNVAAERLVQPDEFSDEDEATDGPNLSLLEKADSEDLESVRCAAARSCSIESFIRSPLTPSSIAATRATQDSASEIQPEDSSPRKAKAVKTPCSSPLRAISRQRGSSLKRAEASSPQRRLLRSPSNGQHSEEKKASPWHSPKRCRSIDFHRGTENNRQQSRAPVAAVLQTMPVKTHSMAQRVSQSRSQPTTPKTEAEGRKQVPQPQSPSPQARAASRHSSKDWSGLGKTQAALAQLEWQNRRLKREADSLRKRTAQAESLVAHMADIEERCTRLSKENDRLLRRLLLLVSPAEVAQFQLGNGGQVSDLAARNKELQAANDALKKDVDLLKSDIGGCHMCKYLGQKEST